MKIISVRDNPKSYQTFVDYFAKYWASEKTKPVYQDCIENTINTPSTLPQWYLLVDALDSIIGGVGLVTNDFISRMDLFPWLCALHIEEQHRNQGYGSLLIKHVCAEAKKLGFEKLYLSTDLTGYYERHDFSNIGLGYHPWGSSSKIYEKSLTTSLSLRASLDAHP